MVELRKRWRSDKFDQDLVLLVELAPMANLTVAHDRIYAFMGLASEKAARVPVVVDYGAPAKDVFREFTRQAIVRTGRLDMLAFARLSATSDELEDVPTWVWNFAPGPAAQQAWRNSWTYRQWQDNWWFDHGTPAGYGATRDAQAVPQFSADGRLLGLNGLRVAVIAETAAVLNARPAATAGAGTSLWSSASRGLSLVEDTICTYLSWRELADIDNTSPYPGPFAIETNRDAFFRLVPAVEPTSFGRIDTAARTALEEFDKLLVSKFKHLHGRTRDSLTTRDRFHLGMVWAKLGLDFHLGRSRAQWLEAGSEMVGSEASSRRRMFQTSSSLLGLGSADVQVGDEVVLLPGSRVPWVLRRGSGPSCKLLSESFVYRIMGGHGWEPDRCAMLWIE